MDKLAYFDSSHDFPEEIAMAAGFTPYKILGDVKTPNDPADQYLQNFICPAARSFMTEALAHSGEWAGIVLAHGCDTTHRFYDIWKMHVKTPFLHYLNVPMNYERKSAAKFFKLEMKILIRKLEANFGVKITDVKLKEAIKISNEIKGKLQKLGVMRGERDITNREYLDLCVKSLQLPKADILTLLDKKIVEWAAKPVVPASKKKILLTGSDVT